MLGNVFTKSIRDRRIATLVGVLGVVSVAVLGLAAYSGLDQTISEMFNALPEAFLSVVGITDVTSAGSLVLGEMSNLMAPLALAGLAISMGASAIAGEEAAGTMGVLLANPRSRTQLLLSKTAAMAVLLAVATFLVWGGSYLVALAYGTDMSRIELGAAMTHVFALALFFGALALFLGSWTGNRTSASGWSAGVLILSFLAGGLLPLIESLADFARVFPWYYFNSSRPLSNGVDWGHLAVLLGGAALLVAVAVVGVNRRDLRAGEGGSSLLERLKEHPMTAKLAARLTGTAKVSSIAAKTTSEYRGVAVVSAMAIFYIALVVGPMYNALSGVLVDLMAVMPKAVLALVGGVDMSTPEGWFHGELFSMVVPAAIIVVTVVVGSRSLAGEEEANTMDLLLSNPVKRSRIVLEKALAMVLLAFILGVATFLGVSAGAALGGLGISYPNIGGASLLAALLGLAFGSVALLVGGATGSRKLAAYTASGLAFVAYFADSFLSVSDRLAVWARLSPFHYYTEGEPLLNGMNWGSAAVLSLLAVILLAGSIPLFERRDIRG